VKSEVVVEAETTSTGQDLFARRCCSPGPPIAPLWPGFVVEATWK